MDLKSKLLFLVIPIFILLLADELVYTNAFMKSVRIEEIPFALSVKVRNKTRESPLRSATPKESRNIYGLKRLDQHKSFLKIFNIPCKLKACGKIFNHHKHLSHCHSICFISHWILISGAALLDIICFFAAKGKWPFIPPFMQSRVDAAARTLFSQNDSFIKQFCHKWIQIKECFRPIFSPTTASSAEVVNISNQRCKCANLVASDAPVPVVYFDRDHIGNISLETISNTIEFLQNFLPPPTKKGKRKNRVRSRVDDMDIER